MQFYAHLSFDGVNERHVLVDAADINTAFQLVNIWRAGFRAGAPLADTIDILVVSSKPRKGCSYQPILEFTP